MNQYKFKEALVIPLSDGSELALIIYERSDKTVLVPAFNNSSQIPMFKHLLTEYGINPAVDEIVWGCVEEIRKLSIN